tara:strand:- start:495 stop:902 length:408 start_codon:yes stop_codon:yes gene_type:complete
VNPEPFAPWVLRYISAQKRNVANVEETCEVYRRHFGENSVALLSFEGCKKKSNPFSVLLDDIMHLPVEKFSVITGAVNSARPSLYMDILSHASEAGIISRNKSKLLSVITCLVLLLLITAIFSLFFRYPRYITRA